MFKKKQPNFNLFVILHGKNFSAIKQKFWHLDSFWCFFLNGNHFENIQRLIRNVIRQIRIYFIYKGMPVVLCNNIGTLYRHPL
jgi:hypothetical protein